MDAATSEGQFPEFNIDPALAETVETTPADQIVEGVLRLENPKDVPPLFSVVSQFNRICTGRFRTAHIWTIRQHPNVISFKASRPLGISYDEEFPTAQSLPEETETLSGSPSPFEGCGCIVAALDFGLDFAHPNFLNPDGTTRLVSFWHQGATYDAAHPNRYGYGRMFSREEINAALHQSDPYQALGYHPAISDTGSGSHGTHTFDIAAGNGQARGSLASPAARADLIFVHLSTPRLGLVGDLGDSVRMLEALDHVDRTAGGRPWVVNLSVGRTAGSHDGTSLVEQGMHELLRRGPGRAIVQSAGNYRSANLAVEGWCRDGEYRDLEWVVDPADITDNEIDVWYSGKDRFVIAIRPPQETAFVEVKLGEVADIVYEGTVVGRLYHRRNDPNNRDNHAEVFLYPGAPHGVWTLRLIGEYVISGRFHSWIERDLARPGAQSRFDAGITSKAYTLGTIATSPLVITVGAYDAHTEGTPLAPFSSCGPTRDERRDKPELLAPGVGVIAARSIPRGALWQEGLLVARSGTSMAAPHVTGTVAAMFEAAGRPVFIDEIRDCLKRSAEPLTDAEQAACFAWGRLNVVGAIRQIRGSEATNLASQPLVGFNAPDEPVMFFESTDNDAAESFAGTTEIEGPSESGDSGVSVLVVDERGQPLVDGKYAIYQGGRSEQGEFAKFGNGLVLFQTIDATQPFMFEVRDRVCAIAEGAFLNPDEPSIEYGGTWFDWTLVRDNKNPETAFWPYYHSEMKSDANRRGVDRFWQHEHIVRRPIRAVAAAGVVSKPVKICAVPPQIRTGPLVRYTDHRSASIWLETVTPSQVRVRAKRAGGREAEKINFASTVRVGGRHFAVVEVNGLDEDTFYQYTLELAPLPANVAIPIDPQDFAGTFPEITTGVSSALRRQLVEASVEKIEWLSFRTLRSRYDKSLRFATGSCRWYPGDVIGGNKNKPGKYWGPDMLDKLGEWLCQTPRERWPHFQFYGGDQIYADEIGDRHHEELIRARFASRLPGPKDPSASVADRLIDGAWAGRFAHRLEQLKPPPPKLRENVEAWFKMVDSIYAQAPALKLFANRRVTEKQLHDGYQNLLTRRRDVQRASREADDEREARIAVDLLPRLKQLLVTAEPFRVYRPYWDVVPDTRAFNRQTYSYRSCNFLLWRLPNSEADLPTLKDQSAGDIGVRGEAGRGHASADNGRHVADFAEYAFLYERAWTTTRNVRVLLGNVPTFLMLDDHEVTDDWNFDVAWVRMVHSMRDHYRMWPKTITDALCAYWVYQGLGNKAPSQWKGDPRAEVLNRARREGIDALPELRRCIYRALMAASPENATATFQTGQSLQWHYRLPFEPPFMVPDCRTRKRLVPADDAMRVIDHKRNPPQSETIDTEQLKWMRDILDGCKHQVAFIAPSTPLLLQEKLMVFMTKPETAARAWADEVDLSSGLAVFLGSTALAIGSTELIRLFRREKDLEHMIRDKSWRDLWDIVERLRRNRSPVKTLVLVSGDVHHSYCMTANLSGNGRPFPELLQITSSGLQTTIRGGTKEGVAAWQSSLSSDFAGHHLVPGFMSKPGSRRRELALYKNAVTVVDVSLGKDVDVRAVYLAGDETTQEIEQYVYQYTSAPSYLKMGEPSNTPYRMGESAEAFIGLSDGIVEPIESDSSSLDPGQSIIVDGQQVRTNANAERWYTARRDLLQEHRRGFVSERQLVPTGLDDLIRMAEERIKAARTLGSRPMDDSDVEAMLEWFDRYVEILNTCDSQMETIVVDRFRATREQNEKFKTEVERLLPRLRDIQRSAFRAEDRNKLKEVGEVFATTLDSVLVAEHWVRDAATTMKDFIVLGSTLRTQKALHGSRQPWHELMRQSTNARVAKLLSIAKGLNKVLAAWQLVDAGVTLLAGGKTASAGASAGISFVTTVASAGGTLLGASGFFSLYNNLYIGPMVKRILGQIEQLKNLESTGNNHPLIQLGNLDAVNWNIEPGGREMYEFMFGVMKARTVRDVKMIPDGVRKYFSKHRKDFDAGTPKRHGEKLNYEEFEDKRVWVYTFHDDIWGMLYGSMPVPQSMRK